jgi:hypothetical protein
MRPTATTLIRAEAVIAVSDCEDSALAHMRSASVGPAIGRLLPRVSSGGVWNSVRARRIVRVPVSFVHVIFLERRR